MNEINTGEMYYLTARVRSLERAEAFLQDLETLPIQPLSNTFPQVLEAARIKAQYPVSYADAFAIATAVREGAALISGDPEFRAVAHLVDILWTKPRLTRDGNLAMLRAQAWMGSGSGSGPRHGKRGRPWTVESGCFGRWSGRGRIGCRSSTSCCPGGT